MQKIDLHIHSINSSDGHDTVKDIVKIAKQKGLTGVAITDHNKVTKVKSHDDFIVLSGSEIDTEKGHVIALGINEKIPKFKSVEETINLIHEQGGLAIATHPYDFCGKGVGHFHNYKFDAIEVLNGLCLDKYSNIHAKKMAQGWVHTAGTDSHTKETVGICYTKIDSEMDVDKILKAIRNGKTSLGGRTISPAEFVKSAKINPMLRKKPKLKYWLTKQIILKIPAPVIIPQVMLCAKIMYAYNYLRVRNIIFKL